MVVNSFIFYLLDIFYLLNKEVLAPINKEVYDRLKPNSPMFPSLELNSAEDTA